jgi:hypothetical protein
MVICMFCSLCLRLGGQHERVGGLQLDIPIPLNTTTLSLVTHHAFSALKLIYNIYAPQKPQEPKIRPSTHLHVCNRISSPGRA